MNKILSIIIPTYNMEKYLRKCLDSLILSEEKMKLLEVLVVNDGSKDSSSAIAHQYEKKYPKTIKVVDKENGNYGSCINRGLNEAQGKYVKILDADDYYDNTNFALFLDYLKDNELDCVISDMVQVDVDGKIKKEIRYSLPVNNTFALSDLSDTIVNNMWMHCVCYRTDNLRRIGYRQTEGISYTDQEWICLPMSTVSRIGYFPHVIYHYLVGRDGQTINIDVWERNFWQEVKGAGVMIEKYHLLPLDCSEQGRQYVDKRIRKRIEVIYDAFFLNFVSCKNNDIMIAFDANVMKYNRSFYYSLDKKVYSKYFHYHYIKKWRKGYNIVQNRRMIFLLTKIKALLK